MCKCVLYFCYRVRTQLQLTNISYIYIYIYIYISADLPVGCLMCRSFTSEMTVLKFRAEPIYYAQWSVNTLFLWKVKFGHVVTEFYHIPRNIYFLKSSTIHPSFLSSIQSPNPRVNSLRHNFILSFLLCLSVQVAFRLHFSQLCLLSFTSVYRWFFHFQRIQLPLFGDDNAGLSRIEHKLWSSSLWNYLYPPTTANSHKTNYSRHYSIFNQLKKV